MMWNDLITNRALIAGLAAMCLAQLMKPFCYFWVEHQWDWLQIFSSGGMPSSHSALITATTTVIGFQSGFNSTVFALGLVVMIIVTYDAANVRWQSGLHAQKINQLIRDVFRGEPISEETLKEVIGHTPRQVYAGIVLGIIVGIVLEQIWTL